jgi:hypothetical protein
MEDHTVLCTELEGGRLGRLASLEVMTLRVPGGYDPEGSRRLKLPDFMAIGT